MAYYDRADIPFHYELADTFTVCDAYHCSMHSSTTPNRNYWVSGTRATSRTGSARSATTPTRRTRTRATTGPRTPSGWSRPGGAGGVPGVGQLPGQQPGVLRASRRSRARRWPAGADQSGVLLRRRCGRRRRRRRRAAARTGWKRAWTRWPADGSLFERGAAPGPAGGSGRRSRGRGGRRLPAVSYLVPSSLDSEHPGASSPVAQRHRSSTRCWTRWRPTRRCGGTTVVFITYDENDGFFDHWRRPPPADVAEEWWQGRPLGLGMRVPMTVVSPWTVGGYVCSQVFDHTSITRFLEKWLGSRCRTSPPGAGPSPAI